MRLISSFMQPLAAQSAGTVLMSWEHTGGGRTLAAAPLGCWVALLPASDLPPDVLCPGPRGPQELVSDSSQTPCLGIFLGTLGSLGVLSEHQARIIHRYLTPHSVRKACSPPLWVNSQTPQMSSINPLNYFFGYPDSAQGSSASITPYPAPQLPWPSPGEDVNLPLTNTEDSPLYFPPTLEVNETRVIVILTLTQLSLAWFAKGQIVE